MLEGRAVGLYVAGSLASGDYRTNISDVDAVALVAAPLDRSDRARLAKLHRGLVDADQSARRLHCVYVPRTEVLAVERKHWTWAFEEFFRRPLAGIARAELLADPIILFGPEPSSWLPPMDRAALRDAARAELTGYWARAIRKRAIWREDAYVDLGLTVWARADATIREGLLITKSEAIERMRSSGLPPAVIDGVLARRNGEVLELGDRERAARAMVVRGFLAQEFARLSAKS